MRGGPGGGRSARPVSVPARPLPQSSPFGQAAASSPTEDQPAPTGLADPFAGSQAAQKIEKEEENGFDDIMAQKQETREPAEETEKTRSQDTAGGQEAEESKEAADGDGEGDRKGAEARQEEPHADSPRHNRQADDFD